MNKITIAFFAGLLLSAAGCRWGGIMGNGHIVTDTRSVSEFSEIEADGGFQIEWRTGPPSRSSTQHSRRTEAGTWLPVNSPPILAA